MKVSVVRPSSTRCSSIVCQHFQTTSPLKPRSRFFSYFTYSIYRSRERIIVCFCSGRIRTVVATATYSSHRLIMGKEDIDHFFFLIVDICIFFYRNVYSVVLYVSYDFCLNRWIWLVVGAAKRVDFLKMFKNLLRNHKGYEAETWHTCLGHWPLYKLCFLFLSDKNSGCYGNL